MDFREYQAEAYEFARYPDLGINPAYPTLGLTGEAGEVANKVKKIYRDQLKLADVRKDIAAELGDVLWYLAALATEFDLDLGAIAQSNLDKLWSRKERDVLGGSGDNR